MAQQNSTHLALGLLLVSLIATGCNSSFKPIQFDEPHDKPQSMKIGQTKVIAHGDMLFIENDGSKRPAISTQAAIGFAEGFDSYGNVLPTTPWAGGIVPVKFDSTITESKKAMFFTACQRWSEVANVKCIPATHEPLPLLVTEHPEYSTFCASFVGRLQPGYFSLGSGDLGGAIFMGFPECWDVPTIIHELGHALGFEHEQDRADRVHYIDISSRPECQGVWPVKPSVPTNTPYDLLSVMHYPVSSSTGGEQCAQTKPEYDHLVSQIGMKDRPSRLDAQAMASIYGVAPGTDQTVIGNIDGFIQRGGESYLYGWACARNTATSVAVHLYARSSSGSMTGLSGSGVANLVNESQVSDVCGTVGIGHRFEIPVSSYLSQFSGHSLVVFGISPVGKDNLPLNRSGEIFLGVPPVAPGTDQTVIGHIDGVYERGTEVVVAGWACARNTAVPIAVHLYAMAPSGAMTGLDGSPVANRPSELAVSQICGTNSVGHRFEIQIAQHLAQVEGQSIVIFGISPIGKDNLPLIRSTEIRFPAPVRVPPPSPVLGGGPSTCSEGPGTAHGVEDETRLRTGC